MSPLLGCPFTSDGNTPAMQSTMVWVDRQCGTISLVPLTSLQCVQDRDVPEAPWEPSAPCPLPVRVPRLMMVFLPGHIGAFQHNPILLELVAVGQTGTRRSLTEIGAAPQVMLSGAKTGSR